MGRNSLNFLNFYALSLFWFKLPTPKSHLLKNNRSFCGGESFLGEKNVVLLSEAVESRTPDGESPVTHK
jgi:hypothetical protein